MDRRQVPPTATGRLPSLSSESATHEKYSERYAIAKMKARVDLFGLDGLRTDAERQDDEEAVAEMYDGLEAYLRGG